TLLRASRSGGQALLRAARSGGQALLRAARSGGQGRANGWLPPLGGRLVRPVFIISAPLIAAAIWLRCGPLPPDLLKLDAIDSTVVVDRNGIELYEALGSDGTRAQQMRAGSIPAIVAAATVAAEDRGVWSHHGIDPIAVLRAINQNLAEGSIVEGGSTITQQAAKLLLLRRAADRRRGWRTKLQEGVIALRLEHRLSKREILALYLNLASYGNQTTGFERASRVYFGVGSAMLTPAQGGFLAGLPQRP